MKRFHSAQNNRFIDKLKTLHDERTYKNIHRNIHSNQ